MPYSYNVYGPKGPGDTIVVNFPFLSRDHINILVDGSAVDTSKWSWVNDGLINTQTGFPIGTITRVQRTTPINEAQGHLIGSAVLNYEAINANDTQLLYALQERADAEDARQHQIDDIQGQLDTQIDTLTGLVAQGTTIRDQTEDLRDSTQSTYNQVVTLSNQVNAARDEVLAAVPNVFSVTRTSAKAVNTALHKALYLVEPGREGQFVWTLGDFSSKITGDPLEAIYLKADGIAATVGAWVRVGNWKADGVNLEWFGAKATTGFNNFAILGGAALWCWNNKVPLRIPSGTFEYSGTLDLGYPGLVILGAGSKNSKLKCTSSGRAVDILENRPNNGAYAYRLDIRDVCFEGNANTTDIIRIRINHPNLQGVDLREASSINGVALRIEGTVSGEFNISCSTNAQLMSSRPLLGIVLDASPVDGRRASNNHFITPRIEGMIGYGIDLIAGDNNKFSGGTSENNGSNGVTLHPGTHLNKFEGMGFENYGYADIYDEGMMNHFEDCYANKNVYIGNASQFSHIEGGYFKKIEVAASASFPTINNIKINFFNGTEGIVLNGNTTVRCTNIFDVNAGAMIFPKPAASTPAVGASPFTYTNGTGRPLMIVITGGTVSQVMLMREGSDLGPVPLGAYMLMPKDGVRITYTVAPAVYLMPSSL